MGMSGSELDGREIRVDFSLPKSNDSKGGQRGGRGGNQNGGGRFGRVEPPSSPPSATLFVANMSFNCTEDSLRDVFSTYGDVASVRIPTDRESGRVKGCVQSFGSLNSLLRSLVTGNNIG